MTTPTPALMAAADHAIATIESSRLTHVQWRDWLGYAEPGVNCGGAPACDRDHHADVAVVVGDVEHHQRCITAYDQVLKVLRHVRASTDPLSLTEKAAE